jgi:hypothetical protein
LVVEVKKTYNIQRSNKTDGDSKRLQASKCRRYCLDPSLPPFPPSLTHPAAHCCPSGLPCAESTYCPPNPLSPKSWNICNPLLHTFLSRPPPTQGNYSSFLLFPLSRLTFPPALSLRLYSYSYSFSLLFSFISSPLIIYSLLAASSLANPLPHYQPTFLSPAGPVA